MSGDISGTFQPGHDFHSELDEQISGRTAAEFLLVYTLILQGQVLLGNNSAA